MFVDPILFNNIFCIVNIQYFFIALILIIIVRSYRNNYLIQLEIDKKLSWIPTVPGYPFLGNILQLSNTTTILPIIQELLLRNNGIWRSKYLNEHNIFISDHKFLEWILTSNEIIDKGSVYRYYHKWLNDGILIARGETWKKSRRILTPSFNFKILEQFISTFDDAVSVLIEILNKEIDDKNEEIQVQDYMLNYTLEILCQTFMGLQLNIQHDHNSEYSKSVHGMSQILINRSFNLFKRSDFLYRFTKDFYKEREYVKHLHDKSNRVINMRRKELNDNVNENNMDGDTKQKMIFLDLLLKYRDENGNPLSHEFIRREVDTIMFAGHDTTASALSFALYCLSVNPQVQIKAFEEIKEIFENDKNKVPTYRDLQDMKYLEAVIKETLRLYPSVPFFSRKVKNDIFYQEDKCIPKNTILIAIAYALNRDPQFYSKPEDFIPERFLEDNIQPFTYLPFSAGPRNCFGQKFAMLEMKTTLSKILLNFELKPAKAPSYKPIVSAEVVLTSKNGIKVQFKKRN